MQKHCYQSCYNVAQGKQDKEGAEAAKETKTSTDKGRGGCNTDYYSKETDFNGQVKACGAGYPTCYGYDAAKKKYGTCYRWYTTNPKWITYYFKKRSEMKDKYDFCSDWATNGDCTQKIKFMQKNCYNSCYKLTYKGSNTPSMKATSELQYTNKCSADYKSEDVCCGQKDTVNDFKGTVRNCPAGYPTCEMYAADN